MTPPAGPGPDFQGYALYGNYLYSIGGREPEGMAIQVPDPSQPTKVRLCFSFSGLPGCGDTSHRRASIYSKDTLIS